MGYEDVAKTGYKTKAIQDAVNDSKLNKQLLSKGVLNTVYKAFKENTRYKSSEIKQKLSKIYDQFGITYKRSGCSERIGLYFHIKSANCSDSRGWKLLSRKY